MNLSLAMAIMDENLKGPTATFDEMGLSAVRWAWLECRAHLPAENDAGSPSEASAGKHPLDEPNLPYPLTETPRSTGKLRLTAALVALAQRNVPPDVQELLVQGDPRRSIRPGALLAAIEACCPPQADSQQPLPEPPESV